MKIKALFLALLTLSVATFFVGCGSAKTPYENNDAENYTVSVKYDANGGVFTTNTSVIVDSFNITDMKADASGNAQIALLSPDNNLRGNDAFTAVKNGYFLAGWYAERTETTDADGNSVYVYGNKWDFDKDLLKVDKSKTYSASEPVMTLYAAWVPMFAIEFYSLADGSLIDSITYNPTLGEKIMVPAWDTKTGAIEMYDFPTQKGYTFDGVYLDAEGKQQITTDSFEHTGVVDYANGVAKNPTMKLYVDYVEGEWYHISTVEQFVKNASLSGNYEIHADLDFTDEVWPTVFMYGNFTGTIKGNGHVFKNIQARQTNNSKVNAGLFGNLTESANISDLTFENASFTIQAGTRVMGTSFGFFAGTISDSAQLTGVKILSSTLKIDSKCYFTVEDYVIGLVCGMGNAEAVEEAQISCEATGDAPENVQISVNGNQVTVTIVTP
jgi:hypothetical protein